MATDTSSYAEPQVIPLLQLPVQVPRQTYRQAQSNIPDDKAVRIRLKQITEERVKRTGAVPPLTLDELTEHTAAVLAEAGLDPIYGDYTSILVSNAAWRDSLARIPYERRLLLIPKCLRVEEKCPAPFDEFGLLCKQCGLCTIQDLQEEAEKLGYAVLVAEGSALVMALIQTGKIEAIVGVSCLSVLERAFPFMEAAAIPGVAIPLLQDDCKDTGVDVEWVWDFIHATSDDRTRRLDLDALRRDVESWFEPEALDALFGGPPAGETETLARAELTRAGKRWRPFLTVCVHQALRDDPHATPPDALRKVALAVECFHKASLVHDDIEDGDARRYGEPTLHASHGIPAALNAGDYLIGEGYRLLAESDFAPEIRARMTAIAARGHRTLCLGQGEELAWARSPKPLSSQQVLQIFRQKTAPAFGVALELGAACARADEDVFEKLRAYSDALGIAYQIRDDLDDFEPSADAPDDVAALRPSLPLAVGYEQSKSEPEARAALEAAWRREQALDGRSDEVRDLLSRFDAADRSRRLMEGYKEEAIRCLPGLTNPSLKGLLRRVIGKIFSVEIQGWCSEFEARNAAGSQAVADVAG
jgi:geranylgeranyl pyrophosphate synthase